MKTITDRLPGELDTSELADIAAGMVILLYVIDPNMVPDEALAFSVAAIFGDSAYDAMKEAKE